MTQKFPITPVHMTVDLRPQRAAGIGLGFPERDFAATGGRVELYPDGRILAHGVEHRLPDDLAQGLVHDLTPSLKAIGMLTDKLGTELEAFAAARGLRLPLRSLSFSLRDDRATAVLGGVGRGQAAVRRSLGRVSFDPPHQPPLPRGDRPHPHTIAAIRRWNDTWGEDSYPATDAIARRGGELIADLVATSRTLIPTHVIRR
jgi:hypothetical protein